MAIPLKTILVANSGLDLVMYLGGMFRPQLLNSFLPGIDASTADGVLAARIAGHAMLFHGIVRLIVGLNLNDSPIVRYLGAASYLAEAFLLCSEMVAGGASKSAIPVILLVLFLAFRLVRHQPRSRSSPKYD